MKYLFLIDLKYGFIPSVSEKHINYTKQYCRLFYLYKTRYLILRDEYKLQACNNKTLKKILGLEEELFFISIMVCLTTLYLSQIMVQGGKIRSEHLTDNGVERWQSNSMLPPEIFLERF